MINVLDLVTKLEKYGKDNITIEELSRMAGVNDKCLEQVCDYYTHYLAYYNPEINGRRLEHEEFHAASIKCMEAQNKIAEWMENNEGDPTDDPTGRYLWESAETWERRVAA